MGLLFGLMIGIEPRPGQSSFFPESSEAKGNYVTSIEVEREL
jgi:hypothetical protein